MNKRFIKRIAKEIGKRGVNKPINKDGSDGESEDFTFGSASDDDAGLFEGADLPPSKRQKK